MDSTQFVVWALIALVAVLYLRRMFFLRSLKHRTPAEAAELVRNGGAILLDVRTMHERQRTAIKGALHIPLHEIRQRSGELGKYKGKEIICYCTSGSRSASATATLTKLGFNAANMKGGIVEWNSSGLT
jgi:rhodanese-related sulfurtransferase